MAGISRNDEMLDAARRFITWDLKRIEKVASRYAQDYTLTQSTIIGGGIVQIKMQPGGGWSAMLTEE